MDGEGPGGEHAPGPSPYAKRPGPRREEPARYGVMSTFNAVRPSIAR
ncbi:hypothetical protein YUYDRAFT_06249 [Streptomyces sp. ScaeMP-e48]|nr:hypothetical protein YUYDRAFT_06249 [Streptomyces sp. ScaeMP-e48]